MNGTGTGKDIENSQTSTRFEHPVHFRIQPFSISDVRRRHLDPDKIKASAFKRHIQPVAVVVVDLMRPQFHPFSQIFTNFVMLFSEIKASNTAPVADSQTSRRSANSRPDIQHVCVPFDPQMSGKIDSRGWS